MHGATVTPSRQPESSARFGWQGRRPKSCWRASRRGHLGATWLTHLDAENVQAVVLDRREDAPLVWALRWSRDWVVDYADRCSVILVRAG